MTKAIRVVGLGVGIGLVAGSASGVVAFDTLGAGTDLFPVGTNGGGNTPLEDIVPAASGEITTVDVALTQNGFFPGGTEITDVTVEVFDASNNLLGSAGLVDVGVGTDSEIVTVDFAGTGVSVDAGATYFIGIDLSQDFQVGPVFYGDPTVGSSGPGYFSDSNPGGIPAPGDNDGSLSNSSTLGLTVNVVPAPGTAALALGGLGLACRRRR
jgi:hypothetical protein